MIQRDVMLLFLTLGYSLMFGQHRIEGIIQNEKAVPIPYSNVMLMTDSQELMKGEVADTTGYFSFEQIPSGNYQLIISAIGYEGFQQDMRLVKDVDLGILNLISATFTTDEVTVSAQRSTYVQEADRTIVNVSRLPSAAGGHALELLEKSPAVSVDRASSNVSLLGRDNVVVFLDGQRIRLDGNDLLQYLASIPAAQIVSLELIHNPPASYDADGTGGVINIVTQNFEADGLNGNINLHTGYGQRGKYGGSGVLNYKSGKWNLYADGSTSQDYTFQNSDIVSAVQFDDGWLRTQQASQRPAYIGNYKGKIGLTYNLNSNTYIDVFGVYTRRQWELNAETRTDYEGDISPIPSDFLTGKETNASRQYSISTHIHHHLSPNHSLSADYDYLNFNILNPTRYTLQNLDAEGEPLSESAFHTEKETPFEFHVARLDYQGKWNDKLRFETGVKLTLSHVANHTALLDENELPDATSLFTDSMRLDEQIYAAYISVEGNLSSKLSFSGGVRYEYSDLTLRSKREGVSRQISRFFPTLSLTYQFSELTQLTTAFRERISRPGFQNLAPAFFFLNPYTVLAGNIQALPNINQTLEVTLRHRALFLSLSYATDDNPIIRYAIPFLNQEENLLLLVSDNIDNRQQLGLNIGFPLTFTRCWSSRYSIGSYGRRDQIHLPTGRRIETHPFFTLDISQDFQLHKSWSLSLSGTWNSLVYQGTIYQPQQTTLNLGLQKTFDHATLTLSCTDIFNTGTFLGFVNELPEQGILYDWNYDFEGSIVRLSYSYNFGKERGKKQRRSGASEVLKRVNE